MMALGLLLAAISTWSTHPTYRIDSLGGLNILLSAAPLLEDVPWATLHTRSTQNGPGMGAKDFEKSLCAPFTTIFACLGISPAEYWTNATAVSHFDDNMISAAAAQKTHKNYGVQWHLAWKSNRHLSGQPPETQLARLEIREEELVALVHTILRAMIYEEPGNLSGEKQLVAAEAEPLPKYHCGTFVAFLKRLQHFVCFDVQKLCSQILSETNQPQLSLEMSRQALYFNTWRDTASEVPVTHLVQEETQHPLNPFITISVPKSCWRHVYSRTLAGNTAPAVEGCMTGVKNGKAFHCTFADVQLIFGTVETAGQRGSPKCSVVIKEDQSGWAGHSDIIATFQVPAGLLDSSPPPTKVGLCLRGRVQNIGILESAPALGPELQI